MSGESIDDGVARTKYYWIDLKGDLGVEISQTPIHKALLDARPRHVHGLARAPGQAHQLVERESEHVEDGDDGEQARIGAAELDVADAGHADAALARELVQRQAAAFAEAPDLPPEIAQLGAVEGALGLHPSASIVLRSAVANSSPSDLAFFFMMPSPNFPSRPTTETSEL